MYLKFNWHSASVAFCICRDRHTPAVFTTDSHFELKKMILETTMNKLANYLYSYSISVWKIGIDHLLLTFLPGVQKYQLTKRKKSAQQTFIFDMCVPRPHKPHFLKQISLHQTHRPLSSVKSQDENKTRKLAERKLTSKHIIYIIIPKSSQLCRFLC